MINININNNSSVTICKMAYKLVVSSRSTVQKQNTAHTVKTQLNYARKQHSWVSIDAVMGHLVMLDSDFELNYVFVGVCTVKHLLKLSNYSFCLCTLYLGFF